MKHKSKVTLLYQKIDKAKDIGLLDTWHFKRYLLRKMLKSRYSRLFTQNKLIESHNYLHETR